MQRVGKATEYLDVHATPDPSLLSGSFCHGHLEVTLAAPGAKHLKSLHEKQVWCNHHVSCFGCIPGVLSGASDGQEVVGRLAPEKRALAEQRWQAVESRSGFAWKPGTFTRISSPFCFFGVSFVFHTRQKRYIVAGVLIPAKVQVNCQCAFLGCEF